MEIDELFGLPAHPLLVHAAVVLLPLAATAAIGLAQGPGDALEERVDETRLRAAETPPRPLVAI
jgi:hypothetical protein